MSGRPDGISNAVLILLVAAACLIGARLGLLLAWRVIR
jgi:hypothetical protein